MKKTAETCPLCGQKRFLTRCWVGASYFSAGKMMRICDCCIDVLRDERHFHVTIDEDEEAAHEGRA